MSLSSDATESRKSVSTYDAYGRIVQKIDHPGERCVTVYDKNGDPVGERESVPSKEDPDGEFME